MGRGWEEDGKRMGRGWEEDGKKRGGVVRVEKTALIAMEGGACEATRVGQGVRGKACGARGKHGAILFVLVA
jgi:hypothetical protein